jgi:hypothetical protein
MTYYKAVLPPNSPNYDLKRKTNFSSSLKITGSFTRHFFKSPIESCFGIEATFKGNGKQSEVFILRGPRFFQIFIHPIAIDEIIKIFRNTCVKGLKFLLDLTPTLGF